MVGMRIAAWWSGHEGCFPGGLEWWCCDPGGCRVVAGARRSGQVEETAWAGAGEAAVAGRRSLGVSMFGVGGGMVVKGMARQRGT